MTVESCEYTLNGKTYGVLGNCEIKLYTGKWVLGVVYILQGSMYAVSESDFEQTGFKKVKIPIEVVKKDKIKKKSKTSA